MCKTRAAEVNHQALSAIALPTGTANNSILPPARRLHLRLLVMHGFDRNACLAAQKSALSIATVG